VCCSWCCGPRPSSAPGRLQHLATDHQPATTIVAFLLVALLQHTQERADATQHKRNAIADGLADLMGELAQELPHLRTDSDELRHAVGLEERESTA